MFIENFFSHCKKYGNPKISLVSIQVSTYYFFVFWFLLSAYDIVQVRIFVSYIKIVNICGKIGCKSTSLDSG